MKGNYHFESARGQPRAGLLVPALHAPDFFLDQGLGQSGDDLPRDRFEALDQCLDERFRIIGECLGGDLFDGIVDFLPKTGAGRRTRLGDLDDLGRLGIR